MRRDNVGLARGLRRRQTDAEAKLWQRLRAGQVPGRKFRRQHPVGPYIVDFVCLDAKLVVEADGSQHGGESDASRDAFLRANGFRVLRFWNNDILLDTDVVMNAIWDALQERVDA